MIDAVCRADTWQSCPQTAITPSLCYSRMCQRKVDFFVNYIHITGTMILYQKREAIAHREHGDETLTQIGRSYT